MRTCPKHGQLSPRAGRKNSWYCKPCKNTRERQRHAGSAETTSVEIPPEPTFEWTVPKESRPPPEPIESRVSDPGSLPRFLFSDGDLHYPIHDKRVEAAKLALARDLKPETWVNVGDAWDCWLLSGFTKEPERIFDPGSRLQEEFDSSRPYFDEAARIAGRYHLILGNHERRLWRLIAANLGLFGLRALEWRSMAALPGNVQVHPYGTRLRVGPVTFEHGDAIGGKFGVKHPGAWLLDNRGNRNTVFGHTHRASTTYRTIWDEEGQDHTYVAINQGHGSDVSQQKYAAEPSWQHGFTVIEYWSESGKPRFTPHLITIVNGRFSFNGRQYGMPWQ